MATRDEPRPPRNWATTRPHGRFAPACFGLVALNKMRLRHVSRKLQTLLSGDLVEAMERDDVKKLLQNYEKLTRLVALDRKVLQRNLAVLPTPSELRAEADLRVRRPSAPRSRCRRDSTKIQTFAPHAQTPPITMLPRIKRSDIPESTRRASSGAPNRPLRSGHWPRRGPASSARPGVRASISPRT